MPYLVFRVHAILDFKDQMSHTRKEWSIILGYEVRLDVWFETKRGRVQAFGITLNVLEGGQMRPVVRYDTAHRVVHKHTFWGGRERVEQNPFRTRSLNEAFQRAYADISKNWERYLELYRGERR